MGKISFGILVGVIIYSAFCAYSERIPDAHILWNHHLAVSFIALFVLALFLIFGHRRHVSDQEIDEHYDRCRHHERQIVMYCQDCEDEFYIHPSDLTPVSKSVVTKVNYGRSKY